MLSQSSPLDTDPSPKRRVPKNVAMVPAVSAVTVVLVATPRSKQMDGRFEKVEWLTRG